MHVVWIVLRSTCILVDRSHIDTMIVRQESTLKVGLYLFKLTSILQPNLTHCCTVSENSWEVHFGGRTSTVDQIEVIETRLVIYFVI